MPRPLNIFLIDDDLDDHEIFLSVIKEFFPEAECATAMNGKQGLDKLIAGEVRPDVIFLDLNMPLMNGKDFLKMIKADPALDNIPVFILSTSSDRETIEESKALGAELFITKPDKYSAWESTLKSVIEPFIG